MAGNITILTPKENFLKVPKGVIYRDDVDALTLGVYVKVIGLGRKWQLNVTGLAKTLGLSVAKIKASFSVLEEAGYLRRSRVKGEGGRFVGWDYEVSSEPFTDLSKNRPSETSDIGENRPSENCLQNRDLNINRELNYLNNKINKINNISEKFDFKKAVLALGVPEEVVNDWLQVRKEKKASNTRTAFDKIRKEIEKSGKSATECIRICAENSWRGFQAEWLNKEPLTPTPSPKRKQKEESLSDYYRNLLAELHKDDPNYVSFLDIDDQ